MKVEPVARLANSAAEVCMLRLTTRIDTRVEHSSASHPFSRQGNNKQADARPAGTTRPHRSRAIISPESIGNPLLRSIDNVMIAPALGRGLDIRDIGASCNKTSN